MPSILDTIALLSRWSIYLMRQRVAGLLGKLMAEEVKKTSLHQDDRDRNRLRECCGGDADRLATCREPHL